MQAYIGRPLPSYLESQVWPDGSIIFQYLATYTIENLLNIINKFPEHIQNFA